MVEYAITGGEGILLDYGIAIDERGFEFLFGIEHITLGPHPTAIIRMLDNDEICKTGA